MGFDRDAVDEARERLIDYPRGMLTRSDRELILDIVQGEAGEELDEQVFRQRRYRMRERVRNGLRDFRILGFLSPEDRAPLFGDMGDTPNAFPQSEVGRSMNDLIRFANQVLDSDIFVDRVEKVLAESIENKLLEKKGTVADVTVTSKVNIEDKRPVDELKQQYDAGEELSWREINGLYRYDRITEEEYTERAKEIFGGEAGLFPHKDSSS